jgi:hypothetical protein
MAQAIQKKTRSDLASLNPNQSAGRRPLNRRSARAEHRGHERPAPPSRRAAPPSRLCRPSARPPFARPASARRPEQRSRRAAPRLRPLPAVRSGSDRASPRLRCSGALPAVRRSLGLGPSRSATPTRCPPFACPPSARRPEKASRSSSAPSPVVRLARARAFRFQVPATEHAQHASRPSASLFEC